MLHALPRTLACGLEGDGLPVGEIARELYRRRAGSIDNQPDGSVGRRLDFEACSDVGAPPAVAVGRRSTGRSEERRVGKECRSGGAPGHYKKKRERVSVVDM